MHQPPLPTLDVRSNGAVVQVSINQPETRNALSRAVRDDFERLAGWLESATEVRSLVLRSRDGVFSAGGDLKSFRTSVSAAAPARDAPDPIRDDNRRFGDLLLRLDRLPQTLVALVDGPAMAGALGILCICDVVIAQASARFAISETSIGVVPGQIAPFLVRRLGLARARALALTGARFDGRRAGALGLADHVCETAEEAEAQLAEVIAGILRCAPKANAVTKELLRRSHDADPLPEVLDWASLRFAEALRGEEGREGVDAFLGKRKPWWAGT